MTDSASVTTSAPRGVTARPPASSPAASPPAAPKGTAPELSAAEQRLVNLGYKPQMRNGEKIYCRREAALGSRISAGQHCGTVEQLETTTREGREGLERGGRGDPGSPREVSSGGIGRLIPVALLARRQ